MKIRSLRHAVAQMVMPRIEGKRLAEPSYRSEMAKLAEEGIGGFILFGGDIEGTPRHLADMPDRQWDYQLELFLARLRKNFLALNF